jgi:hypothetical protein
MSLLAKYGESVKTSTTVVETVTVNITAISKFDAEGKKLLMITDKGTFFPFADRFTGIKPDAVFSLSLPCQASITLKENGEYVNVTSVAVNFDSLSTRSFVASQRLTVQL